MTTTHTQKNLAKKTTRIDRSKSAPVPHGLDEELVLMLKHLRWGTLLARWDAIMDAASERGDSPESFLRSVIRTEYESKRENARLQRRQRANIPEFWEIETFPFARQPTLDRQRVMSYYHSFEYMTKQRNLVWLGPTGCGKTGLATSFLLQALDRGHRGYFVTFPELLQELFRALADRSESRVLKRYLAYDCLVIDEVGYVEVEPAQIGQFFTLMHKRHKKKTTLITSNLGFPEWGSFLHNPHLTSALIDRLTENCHTINIKDGVSLRDKLTE